MECHVRNDRHVLSFLMKQGDEVRHAIASLFPVGYISLAPCIAGDSTTIEAAQGRPV